MTFMDRVAHGFIQRRMSSLRSPERRIKVATFRCPWFTARTKASWRRCRVTPMASEHVGAARETQALLQRVVEEGVVLLPAHDPTAFSRLSRAMEAPPAQ